ncbi:CPBP family intramembrane glutamic endopeptidase [Thermodesulfobacteriota bacterium]
MSDGQPTTRENEPSGFILKSVLGWAVAILLGAAGAFLAKHFDLSNMLAAQTGIGLVGLVGGLSHTFLIKAVGGETDWKHGLILAIVWALSCIGGVTPLFFTLATPMKMSLLAFYSFGVSGAVGGTATAYLMRTVFENAASRDIIPSVVSWSFTFGLAAVASDAVGEILQTFLPAAVAWPIAFGTLALILGGGSGYSLKLFLRADTQKPLPLKYNKRKDTAPNREKRLGILILGLLTLPFYLNDFSNIFLKDWRLWLFIDYIAVKVLPIVVMVWVIRNKRLQLSDFGLIPQKVIPFISVFLIATLAGIFIDQNGYVILKGIPAYPPLGGIPEITDPYWRWIDLTIGLLLVGVSEELVFRGYLFRFLTAYSQRSVILIIVPALAFGFIHWSGGLHQVLMTSAVGAVFMALYLRTRSLPAIILAHFAVNFVDFAEVIPKSLFRFI